MCIYKQIFSCLDQGLSSIRFYLYSVSATLLRMTVLFDGWDWIENVGQLCGGGLMLRKHQSDSILVQQEGSLNLISSLVLMTINHTLLSLK